MAVPVVAVAEADTGPAEIDVECGFLAWAGAANTPVMATTAAPSTRADFLREVILEAVMVHLLLEGCLLAFEFLGRMNG